MTTLQVILHGISWKVVDFGWNLELDWNHAEMIAGAI